MRIQIAVAALACAAALACSALALSAATEKTLTVRNTGSRAGTSVAQAPAKQHAVGTVGRKGSASPTRILLERGGMRTGFIEVDLRRRSVRNVSVGIGEKGGLGVRHGRISRETALFLAKLVVRGDLASFSPQKRWFADTDKYVTEPRPGWNADYMGGVLVISWGSADKAFVLPGRQRYSHFPSEAKRGYKSVHEIEDAFERVETKVLDSSKVTTPSKAHEYELKHKLDRVRGRIEPSFDEVPSQK